MDTIDAELEPFEYLAKKFASKELAPDREENDKYPFGPFFDEVLKKAHEVGFLGISVQEDMEGIAQSVLCVTLENLCEADASLGGIIFTNTVAQEIMLSAGSKSILDGVTSNASNAEDFLIAFPVFNDPSEIKNVADARKEGDRYILSGGIDYLVLGGIAHHALIPASIDGGDDYSFFLIDLFADGMGISEPIVSLGLHACPAVDIGLYDVEGEIIGEEGQGNTYFETASDKMYVAAAAMSSGIMKGSFNEAVEYANERFQGGRKIVNWSEIRMILANMAVKVKIAEMTVSKASRAVDTNEKGWDLCSRAAAIHVQDMACDLTTDGIQVLGGCGYMEDHGQEKRFRDAKQIQAILGLNPIKKTKYIDKVIGK